MVNNQRYRWDFIGLSTDTKPTKATSNRLPTDLLIMNQIPQNFMFGMVISGMKENPSAEVVEAIILLKPSLLLSSMEPK